MRLISTLWTSYLMLYISGKYESNSLFEVAHIFQFIKFPSCFYLLYIYEEGFEACLAFCTKLVFWYFYGPLALDWAVQEGNLEIGRTEGETAGVLQGQVPGVLVLGAGFTGCALCAEGKSNQGNRDSGLNPSRRLCCVCTRLPHLITVVFWEMIKVIIK